MSSTKITLAVILSIILLLGILIGAYFLFIKQTILPIKTISNLIQHTGQNSVVTINTGTSIYKFASSLDSLTGSYVCDSRGNTCPVWGCAETIIVYRDNVKIDTIKKGYVGDRASENNPVPPYSQKIYFDDGTYCDDSNLACFNQVKSGVKIHPLTASSYANTVCSSVDNDFVYNIKNNSFDITLSSAKGNYIQGENVSINVKVINNLAPALAELKLYYEVPTIIGTATKSETKEVLLNIGENNFVYNIPTDKSTVLLRVSSELLIYLPTSYFTGISFPTNILTLKSFNGVQYLLIGTIVEPTANIQITPMPIYLNITVDCNTKLCPTGYTCQSGSGLCIRTDIVEKQLTCIQLGCPKISGHDYYCDSSGICAETVFIYKDCTTEGCPLMGGAEVTCLSNGVCRYINSTTKEIIKEITITCAEKPSLCPSGTTCDIASKLCIKSEIFNVIVQCNSNNDCIKPCSGISSQCISNKCSYSGSCGSVIYTCKQAGCPSGSICQESGVCLKTTIEKQIINIIPSWIKIVLWVGIVFIIVLITLIIFFILRGRKQ